jgi:RNA polymerase-binding transcription factor
MREQTATVSPSFIAQQRRRLEDLRQQIVGGEQRTIANERAALEVRGDEPEDAGDIGATMAQYEITQALHDVDQRRLNDIERALQKIGQGTYGLSDVSGDPIPKARLEATPEAILTVEEEEQREKKNQR